MKTGSGHFLARFITITGIGIPIITILIFFYFFYLPAGIKPYVMDLGGVWEARTSNAVTNVELPGLFQNFGISSFDIVIQRKIVLRDALTNEDLFLTIFGTIFQTGRVYVNGHLIGEIGSYGEHKKLGNIQGMDGFFIQKDDIRKTNEIKLVLQTEDKQSFGIQDHRFYLGVSRYLKPYFEKNNVVNDFFQYGAMFFSILMLIIMGILTAMEWDNPARYKYIATGNYMLSTFLFNLFFSGIFISNFFPVGLTMVCLNSAIILFVLINLEFVQYYYQQQFNVVSFINRAFCSAAIVLYFLNYIFNANNNDIINYIYNACGVYLIVSFSYSIFIVIRSMVKNRIRYGLVIAFAIFVTMMAGISDILSNLGIIRSPLLSNLTISSIGIIATIVVIADFIDISNKKSSLSRILKKSNDNLRKMIRQVRAKKMLEYDMTMASRIQNALLPQKFPDSDCVRFFGNSIPARLVGGDYFDVIPIGERKFLMAIADVMGKGMSASLVMVKVQTLLRALSGANLSLNEMAERINGIIASEFGGERFVTLTLFLYDCHEKKAEYVIYGHEPVFVVRAENRGLEIFKNNNVPLGINDHIELTVNPSIQMKSGDRVVLFTDGVTDAQNEEEGFFGMERFKNIILENNKLDNRELFSEMVNKIHEFRGFMEQSDDITILIMDVK